MTLFSPMIYVAIINFSRCILSIRRQNIVSYIVLLLYEPAQLSMVYLCRRYRFAAFFQKINNFAKWNIIIYTEMLLFAIHCSANVIYVSFICETVFEIEKKTNETTAIRSKFDKFPFGKFFMSIKSARC